MSTTNYQILEGDCRASLADLATGSVQTCISSPPYWNQRDYGHPGQLGLEPIPDCLAWARQEPPCGGCYVCGMRSVYGAELRRVLADDGTVWVNLGDSYSAGGNGGHSKTSKLHGHKERVGDQTGRPKKTLGFGPKQLLGTPWRVALALQADGWLLRQDIIWHKPNPMPSPVKDRFTSAHEYIFLLAKQPRYYFDHHAIQEPATGALPGNKTHKHAAAYAAGDEHARTKSGLVAYAERQRQRARPRVNEAARKALRTDTESRHRSSIPGGQSLKSERPQLRRAYELAEQHGLTQAHLDAIRTCGLSDAGKNRQTQTGAGHNADEQQRLAAEAKVALGGYYREFLLADTRNKRDVWTVGTAPYKGAHFATFPPALITPCVLAGSRPGGLVLDLFNGSGTTGQAALAHGRRYVGCEINPDYIALTHKRLSKVQTSFLSHLAA